MNELLTKTLVVLRALPTYLAAFTAVLTVIAAEVVPLLPGGTAVTIGGYVATVLAAIASAVATIRRLTPVAENLRGVLPVD